MFHMRLYLVVEGAKSRNKAPPTPKVPPLGPPEGGISSLLDLPGHLGTVRRDLNQAFL